MKRADLQTPLQPHQQRVIDKLKASHGVLVAHGVGSGKTLASIAAAEAMGLPIEAIVPAPLIANYHKEMAKHLGKEPGDARVRSYEKAVRDKDINLNALAIMDEAHRARNAGTQISKHVAGQVAKAKARLLLTGTPVYNQPYDLAALLNTAAGRKVLPDDPSLFKKTFVGEETVQAPLLTRIKGKILGHEVADVKEQKLINRDRLISAARGYVDVYQGGGENFPRRADEHHMVDMSPKQMEMYKFHMNKMPWYLKAKIKAGLPLDKQESKDMNAFQGALRQVANTPKPYSTGMTDEDEQGHTPKIQLMTKHLQEMHAKDPNFRGVVYSNYLNAGLEPLSRSLKGAGIPHHVFTGEVSKAQRAQMVNDYNSGKTPVLLISGAGSEGLDLKGTKAIQVMEPHWNESRINQVIGRGIRYKSHEHLPDSERQVKVMRYTSTIPKDIIDKANSFMGRPTDKSIDQYMESMSERKDKFTNQIAKALQEASDYGPLQKRAVSMEEWAARNLQYAHEHLGVPLDDGEYDAILDILGQVPHVPAPSRAPTPVPNSWRKPAAIGLSAAALAALAYAGYRHHQKSKEQTEQDALAKVAKDYGLPTDDAELMQHLADTIPGMTLGKKGRTNTLNYAHPADLTVKSKYDPEHIRSVINSQYGGDIKPFAQQLDDDFLTGGYAAIGDVTKKNQTRQGLRSGVGAFWGSQAGIIGGLVGSMLLADKINNSNIPATTRNKILANIATNAVGFGSPILGATLGFQIGKHTYKPLSAKDMEALQTHPMLVAPKVVKQKTTLKVRE